MSAVLLLLACTAPEPDPVDTGPIVSEPGARIEPTPARPPTTTSAFSPAPLRPATGASALIPRRTIVVGGGPAGIAAAMDLDGPVILLEARDLLGGRGRISGGLSFFVGTEELAELGITLTPDDAVADWETLTGAPPTPATEAWLRASDAVHDRLVDLGVRWTIGRADPILDKWWLHQPDKGGAGLLDALEAGLPPEVEVRLETRVTGLHLLEGRVAGVETESGTILADTVVIATGGFVNRTDLLSLVVPDAPGTFEIGDDEFAQGEALDWADRFGLGTANLDAIGWSAGLVATPGADGTPIRIATATIVPWFWVDETGSRFVDEAQGWSVLLAGAERPRTNVWAIGNWERWVGGLEDPKDLSFLEAAKEAGDVIRCDPDPGVLAALLGVDADGLLATFESVARITAGDLVDPFFRRSVSFAPEIGTTCAYRIGHQAMKGYGGLAVGGDGQVLDVNGVPVPGLWSVGEAAGMAVPGMGGASGWDGSMSAVIWGGWRTAAAIDASR